MAVTAVLVLFIFCAIFKTSKQSITGVTYMDKFDFEERYNNIPECDPLYWHPLHLPEHCVNMYEKLIRSRITHENPVRIMKEAEPPELHMLYPTSYETYEDEEATEFEPDSEDVDTRRSRKKKLRQQQSRHMPVLEYEPEVFESWLTPYEEMIDLLREDVKNNPVTPKITNVPNFGPAAVYEQPISKQSAQLIKKIAGSYRFEDETETKPEYNIHVEGFGKKKSDEKRQKMSAMIKNMHVKPLAEVTNEVTSRPRVQRKKIVKGEYVAIIETKRIN